MASLLSFYRASFFFIKVGLVNPLVHGLWYPASTFLRTNYFEPKKFYFNFLSETGPDSKIPKKISVIFELLKIQKKNVELGK